ncbi:MAG TPA: cytochrome c oxidase assembly protein [Stellaceae bacterium]|nr:cytochrome c oxidase assembly protein [Stellaceae bacterium]
MARRRWKHPAMLVCGLAVLAAAFSPPLDSLADRFFAAHMFQHLLLMFAAAPLLVAARPWQPEAYPLPQAWAERLAAVRDRCARILRGAAFMLHQGVALVISTAVLWIWHIPALYDLALVHEPVHVAEHLSFIAAFALFWRPLFAGDGRSGGLASNLSRAVYLVASAMQGSLLAALITFSDRVVYRAYLAIPHPRALPALADQQLGGAIMWFSGALCYAVVAGLVMRSRE